MPSRSVDTGHMENSVAAQRRVCAFLDLGKKNTPPLLRLCGPPKTTETMLRVDRQGKK